MSDEMKASIQKWLSKIVLVLGVCISVWTLYSLVSVSSDPIITRRVHVFSLLALGYLVYLKKLKEMNWFTLVSNLLGVILAFAMGFYYLYDYDRLVERWTMVSDVTNLDLFFGLALIVLLLIALKRLTGWSMVAIVLVFFLYALFGHLIPGLLNHQQYSLANVIDSLNLTLNGIYSAPITASSTLIFSFVAFGTFLQNSGGGEFFIKMANALFGRRRGGPAKIAIVSSGLMGSISGSATANVATTGAFTIPMMKKLGFSPEFAGAVEAVASTGGGIMPPVMGSAAFIMSELTGIPYWDIVVAAIIPALLYYIAVYFIIDFEAAKLGLGGVEQEKPDYAKLLKEGIVFIAPLILIMVLLFKGFDPSRVGIYAILLTIVCSWFQKENRMGPAKIIKSLEESARQMVLVMLATACAGIIIGSINMTGVAGKVIGTMVSQLHVGLLPILIATMLITIILGMGMPNSATYILSASLMAPVMINMGVPVIMAHMFIIFFSTMSHITPPVMVAGFTAAGIAGADPMKLGFINMRLAAVAFLVPFFAVYQPDLILQGSLLSGVECFVTATMGCFLLAAGFEGWFLVKQPNYLRIVWIAAGLALIFPGLFTDLLGLAVGALLILYSFRLKKSSAVGTTAGA